MGKNFKSLKTTVEDDRWEDQLPFKMVDIRETFSGEFKSLRLVGYVHPLMRFWVPTEASKAYDPYKTKVKQFPAVCIDFDSDTEEFSGNECLYRKAQYKYVDSETGDEKWGRLKPSKQYLIFFIERDRQEERAGIKLGDKLKNPKEKSDIQCAVVPTAFARGVQSAIDLYEKKTRKKNADPTDATDGFDLFFQFDNSQKAEAKYQIQTGDPSPLTDAELKQVELLPSEVKVYPKDSQEKVRDSLIRFGYVIVEPGSTPEETLAEQKSAKAKPRTMKAGVELTDEDEDKPRAKKPAPKPTVEEDEEFTDEAGDLSEDEDETPAPAAKKPAPKARPVVEEEEEEEEAPAPKPKAKAKPVVVEEEEEEEAPAPKPAAKKPAAKPAPVEDDEDDFGSFDDED